MLVYPDQLQMWLYFGHSLLILAKFWRTETFKVLGFGGILLRTHGRNDHKFGMLMYWNHLQGWLDFGHGLLIFLILAQFWLRADTLRPTIFQSFIMTGYWCTLDDMDDTGPSITNVICCGIQQGSCLSPVIFPDETYSSYQCEPYPFWFISVQIHFESYQFTFILIHTISHSFLTLGLFGRRVIVVTCVCPSVRPSVCPSVRLSVPIILVNTITQSVYPINPPNLLGDFNMALSWMVL